MTLFTRSFGISARPFGARLVMTLAALCALFPFQTFAALGVSDGYYVGRGTLFKAGGLVRVPFVSNRMIRGDTLMIRSVANVVGIPIVVDARLRFSPSSRGGSNYDVYSADDLSAAGVPVVVGSAGCNQNGCGFEAKVKNGRFTLREFWVARPDGSFVIANGWQHAVGIDMSYQALFYRQ